MTDATKSLSEIAAYVGGKVIGDGDVRIARVAPIDDAEPGAISFITHPRYAKYLSRTRASAVVVARGASETPGPGRPALLEVADPYVAVARILHLFNPPSEFPGTVSPAAHIEPSALLADGVTVFPHVFVGRGARIGPGTALFPGVFVGEEAEIGADCVLHPNAVVRERCRLGDRVVLHAGAVVGADGFGYAGRGEGRIKIPQVGIVEIEDDVEIGANTTIDRATMGRTLIGRGTKIDNLVQIAHNVTIGPHTVIAAQAGIAGSTRIGSGVTLAGQVGIVNHVTVGDGATIGPQSGVPRDVPAGAVMSSGIGAVAHQQWLRVMTLLPELPRLWAAVRALEKKSGQS